MRATLALGPMPWAGHVAMISRMLRTSTSPRLLLVADRRQPRSDLGQVAVRRFRLARVQVQGRPVGASDDQRAKSA